MHTREQVAWGLAVVSFLLAGVIWFLPVPPVGSGNPAGSGPESAPPDLSVMSPRERFDRLYNRVMQAAEAGREAEVARFAPMAFAAYSQLDSVDADARYHAAVLHLHAGRDPASALRLADSIAQQVPSHLFPLLIRGTVARQQGDSARLKAARRAFVAAWDAEIALGRPEYRDHRFMLDEFRAGASRYISEGRKP